MDVQGPPSGSEAAYQFALSPAVSVLVAPHPGQHSVLSVTEQCDWDGNSILYSQALELKLL